MKFEKWWTQKKTEGQERGVTLTWSVVKVLCFLAWNCGAREELTKEIDVLKKATIAMKRRNRTTKKRARTTKRSKVRESS